MTPQFLFVYGTLRKAGKAHGLLGPEATFEGEGTVQGRVVDVGVYTGLVLSDDPADQIRGEVYLIKDLAVRAAELDAYEGEQYRREVVPVRLADGSSVNAWAYIWKGASAFRTPPRRSR